MGHRPLPALLFPSPGSQPKPVADGRKRPDGCSPPSPRFNGERERKNTPSAPYFSDFGSATIISSSTRAPGEDSWLMHTIVLAGIQSPK